MCGIFGTQSLSKFEILFEANSNRGSFSSSIISLKKNPEDDIIYTQNIHKQKDLININKFKFDDQSDYYIGHIQAPTSSERKWSYETSHPFESMSWLVVHNGVLINWEDTNRRYTPWNVNPVDTSIIPSLLEHFKADANRKQNTPALIKRVLELLEGTFAVCLVDTDNNDIFLARQGSILHVNDLGDFSTIEGKGFSLLPEGKIFKLQNSNWVEINQFKTKSPFLFL